MGFLTVIEGIDGTGKTTLAAQLAAWCGQRGLPCLLDREPTDGPWGRKLRATFETGRLPLEEECELFRLDRADHAERVLRPALAEGRVVILDRYYWSNAAYQGARGADVEAILAANEAIAPVPDLVLWLDIDIDTCLARIHGRGDAPNHFEERESLTKVRNIFRQLHERAGQAGQAGKPRSVRVDACPAQGVVAEEAARIFGAAVRGAMGAHGQWT